MTQPTGISRPFPFFSEIENGMQASEVDSRNKRSHLDMLSSSASEQPTRISKVAKESLGQEAITNGLGLAIELELSSPQPISLIPLDSHLSTSFSSFATRIAAGSGPIPFNNILICLTISDLVTLRKISKQFRDVIKRTQIPFLFKQQLEHKKSIDDTELRKYKTLSGRNLSSNQIEFFYLKPGSQLNDEDVTVIAQNCPYLRKIDLAVDVQKLENLLALLHNSPHLQDLSLRSSHSIQITNDSLTKMAQNCPNLNTFTISHFRQFTNHTILAFVQNCPYLQHLRIESSYYPIEEALIGIVQNRLYLKTFRLSLVTVDNQALITFIQNQPYLEELHLEYNSKLTEDAFIAIAKSCPNLKKFIISSCPNFTNRGLTAFTRTCSNLQHLSIDSCLKITDDSFIEIAKNCSKLEYLALRNLDKLTDSTLLYLATGCPNLTSIRITGNPPNRFDRKALRKGSHAYYLNTRTYPQFDILALSILVKHCAKLKYVTVINCPNITESRSDRIALRDHPNIQLFTEQTDWSSYE